MTTPERSTDPHATSAPRARDRSRGRRPDPPGTLRLRLTYDAMVDAAYLTVTPTGPADVLGPTLICEGDPLFDGFVGLDFNAGTGRIVGFEFHDASASLPPEWLLRA